MKPHRLLYAVALFSALAQGQTAAPVATPYQTFLDASGSPCSGCSLYTYVAGTTTAKATFTDNTGVTQNTNPVVLDTAGGWPIWYAAGAYKLVLKDTNGSLIRTIDNVPGAAASLSSTGGTLTGTLTGTSGTFSGTVTTPNLVVSTSGSITGVLSGGTVASATALGAYTWSQLSGMRHVTLSGYNSGSPLGGGDFNWSSTAATPDNCVSFAGSDDPTGSHGVMVRVVTDYLTPEMCGAKADAYSSFVTATNGSTTIVGIVGSGFTAAMVGKIAILSGAGVSGANLITTVASFTDSTHLVLTVAPSTSLASFAIIGSDDTTALQNWGSATPYKKALQRVTYLTSGTINVWGSTSNADRERNGIFAPTGATIEEITDDVPIMTFYGSRGRWEFPRLVYAKPQPSTNLNAIGLMSDAYPGQGSLYISDDVIMRIEGAAVGFFNAQPFTSTTTASFAAGSTTITVANAQTNALGNAPWMKQMWIQIALHSGAVLNTRISGVSGSSLTLATPVPQSDSIDNGASVQYIGSADYSSTFSHVLIENVSLGGYIDRYVGTHNEYSNLYVRGATPIVGDNLNWPSTATNAVLISGGGQNHFGIVNVEHFKLLDSAFVYNSAVGAPVIGSIHFEGDRLLTNGKALLAGGTNAFDVGSMEVSYCSMISDDLSTSAGIFGPMAETLIDAASMWMPRGKWMIHSLTTSDNIVTSSANPATTPVAFLVRDASSSTIDVEIDHWNTNRSGGFYPAGQLCFSATGPCPIIKNKMPGGTVAYLLKADMTITTAQQMFVGASKGYYRITGGLVANGNAFVLGSPLGGLYSDSGKTTPLTTANSDIAANTTTSFKSLTAISPATTTLFNGRVFFAATTAATTPSTICASSCTITAAAMTTQVLGRNQTANNTNMVTISFGATPHTLSVGQSISISGSTNPGLSGTVKAYVVDVPSTTSIVAYVDSATCTVVPPATSNSCGYPTPLADNALTVTINPTVDVYALGDKFSQ